MGTVSRGMPVKVLSGAASARLLPSTPSLAQAAREFLESHGGPTENATEAWNRAIERGGQPGDEPGAVAARQRTKAIVRGGGKRRAKGKKDR